MCIGKAFLAIRRKRLPVYLTNSKDHEPLVKEYDLKDDKLIDRDFVRLEARPNNSLTSTKPGGWDIVVDEKETLPSWFDENSLDWFDKCRRIMVTTIVPGWIKNGVGGPLGLWGTKVTSIGKLRSVGGYLDLRGTGIKSLGELQSVGGYLGLRGTKVTSLGSVKVKGQIYRLA